MVLKSNAKIQNWFVLENIKFGKMTLTGQNISQVQVIDILGKVVSSNSYATLSEVSVDLSNFNSGIYLVKVTNDAGKTSVIKAIKQ